MTQTVISSGPVSALRRATRQWSDGLHAGLDVLLWGHAYPRWVSLEDLRRMRGPRP